MKRYIILLVALFVGVKALAQDPVTGTPPFGSFERSGFDTVNRQNLNVNLEIPIVSSTGRGIDLNLSLVYDSLIWAT